MFGPLGVPEMLLIFVVATAIEFSRIAKNVSRLRRGLTCGIGVFIALLVFRLFWPKAAKPAVGRLWPNWWQ